LKLKEREDTLKKEKLEAEQLKLQEARHAQLLKDIETGNRKEIQSLRLDENDTDSDDDMVENNDNLKPLNFGAKVKLTKDEPPKATQSYFCRPDCWRECAIASIEGDRIATIQKTYPAAFVDNLGAEVGYNTAQKRINRWAKEVKKQRSEIPCEKPTPGGSTPACGPFIDKKLAEYAKLRSKAGLPINNIWLIQNLVTLLLTPEYGKVHLVGNANFKFGNSWCQRFWKRHNYSSRSPTCKMRETPEKLEELENTFTILIAEMLQKYNIDDALVFNADETAVNLVPTVPKQRAKKGSQRVHLISHGSGKTQSTATIAVAATGEIAPLQVISAGKTVRCHPSNRKEGWLFSHSVSHWQNVTTYEEYINDIVIPFRNSQIKAYKLPEDSWALLIHDLHYSHKDPRIRELLLKNRICDGFVPGGCTAYFQVCDVIVNGPFKKAIRRAFIQYLNHQYDLYLVDCENIEDPKLREQQRILFRPKLNLTHMKNPMIDFLKYGCDEISTPAMKSSIIECFAKAGCLRKAKALAETNKFDRHELNNAREEILKDTEPDEDNIIPGEIEALDIFNDDTCTNVPGDHLKDILDKVVIDALTDDNDGNVGTDGESLFLDLTAGDNENVNSGYDTKETTTSAECTGNSCSTKKGRTKKVKKQEVAPIQNYYFNSCDGVIVNNVGKQTTTNYITDAENVYAKSYLRRSTVKGLGKYMFTVKPVTHNGLCGYSSVAIILKYYRIKLSEKTDIGPEDVIRCLLQCWEDGEIKKEHHRDAPYLNDVFERLKVKMNSSRSQKLRGLDKQDWFSDTMGNIIADSLGLNFVVLGDSVDDDSLYVVKNRYVKHKESSTLIVYHHGEILFEGLLPNSEECIVEMNKLFFSRNVY